MRILEGIFIFILAFIVSGCQKNHQGVKTSNTNSTTVTSPPLGWNSFDSYSCNIYEELAMKEADAFIEKFAPYGYEYFVIDNGWFSVPESKTVDGLLCPVNQHANPEDVVVDENGIVQPSKLFFPNGLEPLIKKLHKAGLKFGLHLMRGIPRVAVEKNLTIKGTNYSAKDIYTEAENCTWCTYMHGVDMSKPGAQEYYNSVINQLAEWGVDYLKVDDVTHKPAEIEAYVKAIEQCGRPIVLSLSPGDGSNVKYLNTYQQTNMVRTTPDIWDKQHSIDLSFNSMRKWQGLENSSFYPDLDMIPFGELCILSKEGIKKKRPNQSEAAFAGYLHHWCYFTEAQKETFITQRAISASPIMIGGSMISMDEHSIKLLTEKEMLACVKNGIHGELVFESNGFELWNTPMDNNKEYGFLSYKVDEGWFAVFNRTDEKREFKFTGSFKGFLKGNNTYRFSDVWQKRSFNYKKNDPLNFELKPNGVVFVKYKKVS